MGLLHDGIEKQRSPNICLNFEIKIPHEDNCCVLFFLTVIGRNFFKDPIYNSAQNGLRITKYS